jgi:ATP-dependent Clp protease ATP-binding subunit ClpA
MKEQRELQTLIDQLERYVKEQDEQIKALHKQVHHLAAEVVSMNRSIGAALAALQTGKEIDVAAAIEILRGVK